MLPLCVLAAVSIAPVVTRRPPAVGNDLGQSEIAAQSAAARLVLADHPLAERADGTFNVLIYYEKFASVQEAGHFIGLAEAAIKSIEPFRSANNVHVRAFTLPESHCLVRRTVKAVLHCDAGLLAAVNNLGYRHFKLAVVSPENFVPYATVARGKNSAFYISTYKGQLTDAELDAFFSTYFMHELGHSLGLRDEYSRQRGGREPDTDPVSVDNGAYMAAPPNCAPDEAAAKLWWNKPASELHTGCAGNEQYLYPETGTLMSDAPNQESYGTVSTQYLRDVLRCLYAAQDATVARDAMQGCTDFTKQFPEFWAE